MIGPQSFSDLYSTYEISLDEEYEDASYRQPALESIDKIAKEFGHTTLFLTPQPHPVTRRTPGGITVRETRTPAAGERVKVELSVWAI